MPDPVVDPLATAGLEPEGEPATPEPTPDPPAPEADEPIVVPEGAENPDAVKNAIKAERNKAREANARARDLERQLQERNDADKPLEDRIAEADKRATEADLRALRIEVGVENGLSLKLASRLAGSTREELTADAVSLVAEVGTTPKAGLDGGYKKDPPAAKVDPGQAHGQFLGAIIQQHNAG